MTMAPTIPMKASYYQIVSCALAAITGWNVLVVTLEVNDFRYKLKAAYSSRTSDQEQDTLTLEQYIASLMAIRLGLRDAIIDWLVWYLIGYSIVAGFTWNDADPNTVLVIWGISVMVAALICAVCALKVPQWLGFYHKSRLQILKDTSGLAKTAVQDLVKEGGSTITAFRYRVRLGVGAHFFQFAVFLLPFYVAIKIWFWLLSVIVGVLFGQSYMLVVYLCRKRFSHHRRRVTICASIFFTIVSGIIFSYGLATIDLVWNWSPNGSITFFQMATISFFSWTGALLLLQVIQYCEQDKVEQTDEDDDTMSGNNEHVDEDPKLLLSSSHFLGDDMQTIYMSDLQHIVQQGEEEREAGSALQEPLISGSISNEQQDSNKGSYYSSGHFHFDRLIKKEMAEIASRIGQQNENGVSASTRPDEIYKSLTSLGQDNEKWYTMMWHALPIKPALDLLLIEWRSTISCCKRESDFKTMSCGHKTWFVVWRTIKIVFGLLAVYVAIVCCGATYQIKVTKSKLPYVYEALYSTMNEGPVCAFDYKCGKLKTYSNEIAADLANATIAHCGACASCSSWNDLELQWSTRHDLAERAQKCGTKTMFQGTDALQDCLEEDIGWTEPCAWCWAEDIVCSKKFCIFIFLQSQMTNQIGNFEVGPETITSATCEEANCEAGNPGEFVACSGSTRRRMNITSDIERPGQQQCAIVGIPNSDWGAFFDPKCPE